MHRALSAGLLVASLLGLTLAAQTTLSNSDIVAMVAAKLSDAVVVTAVQTATDRRFDLSPNGLIALKAGGVSDAVIVAMQQVAAAPRPTAPAVTTAAGPMPGAAAPRSSSAAADPEPIDNAGVYKVFGIDNASGKLTPLEEPKVNTNTDGYGTTTLTSYKGATSTVLFDAADQPLRFAVRYGYDSKSWDKEVAKLKSQPLSIRELKVSKDVRIPTTTTIRMDVTPIGSPSQETSRNGKPFTFQTFVYTGPAHLAPGEYMVSDSGFKFAFGFTKSQFWDGLISGKFKVAPR